MSRAVAAAVPRLSEVAGCPSELTRDGTHVQLLRSIFLPEDETCLYLFEGTSREAVREVATRSGLQVERVVEAVSESEVIK